MQYFFIPGRLPKLSRAELIAVLDIRYAEKYRLDTTNDMIFLLNIDIDRSSVDRIFNRLGGFVRYGEIIENLDTFLDQFKAGDDVTFGVSAFTDGKEWDGKRIKQLLKQIKNSFKERDVKSRYIIPKKKVLNAGQIIQNSVIEDGFELVIMDEMYGRTYGIQDIEGFSEREFDKPLTDKEMGVLPAKLARIMLNLTSKSAGSIIWDPFCGSGTILLEGLVLGYDMLGSDISDRAVGYSKRNVQWLSEIDAVGDVKYRVFKMDITKPDGRTLREMRETGVDAVVCEPYMGPPQYKKLSPNRAEELLEDVKQLYVSLFDTFSELKLDENFKIVIVVPSYKTYNGWATMSVNDLVGKKWEILTGKDLHWERPNSIIRRNIFVLSKK